MDCPFNIQLSQKGSSFPIVFKSPYYHLIIKVLIDWTLNRQYIVHNDVIIKICQDMFTRPTVVRGCLTLYIDAIDKYVSYKEENNSRAIKLTGTLHYLVRRVPFFFAINTIWIRFIVLVVRYIESCIMF